MINSYFLAICKDRPDDPNGFIYTVYFVNNTENVIDNLSYQTGGFATCDEYLVQTSTYKKELGRVPAFSFIEIEKDDEGSFDFVINFDFKLTFEDERTENKSFTVGKYLRGGKKPFNRLPVINKFGYAFKIN